MKLSMIALMASFTLLTGCNELLKRSSSENSPLSYNKECTEALLADYEIFVNAQNVTGQYGINPKMIAAYKLKETYGDIKCRAYDSLTNSEFLIDVKKEAASVGIN